MLNQDKRYREGFASETPVSVIWKDRSGHTRHATGATKNLSPLSAFLVCNSLIEEGCAIDLHFDDPIALGGCIPSRISASGMVVRDVARDEDSVSYGHGVRVIFDRFCFARL
jgi:hypothetical protein